MAADYFLKLGDIKGESSDRKHQDWIEVLSFSWGVSQPASATSTPGSTGTTAERPAFNDFRIVKTLDKSSPILFLACASGQHLPELSFQVHRAEGAKQQYLEIKLEDVIISSVRPGGSAQGSEVKPSEEVSFNYGKITWTYTPQMDDGTQDTPVTLGWDLKTNQKI